MDSSNVSLTIGKEIVNPIVEAKVKEAVIAALGGSENVVEMVVNNIMNKKVSENGTVSNYSSENKFDWLDVIVKQKIQEAAKEEIVKIIGESTSNIKDEIIRVLQTKKGASNVAQALIDGLKGTLKNSWNSKIDVTIGQINRD